MVTHRKPRAKAYDYPPTTDHHTAARYQPRKVTGVRRSIIVEQPERYPNSVFWMAERHLPADRLFCRDGPRPCPYVTCRYHLGLTVMPRSGSIKATWPEQEPWEAEQTCALDLANQGGMTLAEIGEVMNLTRERVRQIEEQALAKVAKAMSGFRR